MSRIDELIGERCPLGVELRALGDVCVIKTGPNINKRVIAERPGPYPVINSGRDPLGYVDHFNTENDPIGIASRGSVGLVTWTPGRYFRGNLNYSCTVKNPALLDVRFLYHYILHADVEIQALATHQGIPALNAGALKTLQVPVPPTEIQAEIVRILDAFTELTAELTVELTARKKQYNYYRDQLLSFEDWEVEWPPLGELAENLDSMRKPVTSGLREAGDIPYYGASGIVDYVKDYIFDGDFLLISEDGANLMARSTPIAFSVSGKSWVNNHAHVLKFNTYAERRYVEYYLNSIDLTPYISGAAQPKLNQKSLNSIKIPNPSPEEKIRIVAILDKFDALTNSMSEGLPREIELRQKQYEYYRDLLFGFPKQEEEAA